MTPSAHPRYDIQQIKDDTVWLSKETKIDEVSALRIVVLEWQVRPATQLLRGSLGDEISLQQTGISGSQLGASLSGAGSSLLPTSLWLGRNTSAPFDDTGARRRRLLETYLSERRFILKTSEFIASIASGKCDGGPAKKPEQRAPSGWHWLAEIGGSILSAWNTDGPLKGKGKKPIVDAVDALRARLQGLMSGSGWTTVESLQEDIELIWTRNQILEMIHIMQIILILLESCSNRLTDAESILSWFRLMNDYSFFESIPVVSLEIRSLFVDVDNL